jgi:hypothetical protein
VIRRFEGGPVDGLEEAAAMLTPSVFRGPDEYEIEALHDGDAPAVLSDYGAVYLLHEYDTVSDRALYRVRRAVSSTS